jgi:protein ImuB
MLPEPRALSTRAGQPIFGGVLHLEDDPERIESGWWDGRDVRRDYYAARNPRGTRLWVFRDYRESRWYLHGFFG